MLLRPLAPTDELLALAGRAVAHHVVKVRRSLVVDRGADVEILILLRRVIRHLMKFPRPRHSGTIDPVVQCPAQFR